MMRNYERQEIAVPGWNTSPGIPPSASSRPGRLSVSSPLRSSYRGSFQPARLPKIHIPPRAGYYDVLRSHQQSSLFMATGYPGPGATHTSGSRSALGPGDARKVGRNGDGVGSRRIDLPRDNRETHVIAIPSSLPSAEMVGGSWHVRILPAIDSGLDRRTVTKGSKSRRPSEQSSPGTRIARQVKYGTDRPKDLPSGVVVSRHSYHRWQPWRGTQPSGASPVGATLHVTAVRRDGGD